MRLALVLVLLGVGTVRADMVDGPVTAGTLRCRLRYSDAHASPLPTPAALRLGIVNLETGTYDSRDCGLMAPGADCVYTWGVPVVPGGTDVFACRAIAPDPALVVLFYPVAPTPRPSPSATPGCPVAIISLTENPTPTPLPAPACCRPGPQPSACSDWNAYGCPGPQPSRCCQLAPGPSPSWCVFQVSGTSCPVSPTPQGTP